MFILEKDLKNLMSLVIKYGGIAQLAEHSAVNRRVVGSSPTVTATVLLRDFVFI